VLAQQARVPVQLCSLVRHIHRRCGHSRRVFLQDPFRSHVIYCKHGQKWKNYIACWMRKMHRKLCLILNQNFACLDQMSFARSNNWRKKGHIYGVATANESALTAASHSKREWSCKTRLDVIDCRHKKYSKMQELQCALNEDDAQRIMLDIKSIRLHTKGTHLRCCHSNGECSHGKVV
jgi:hypothetical protein